MSPKATHKTEPTVNGHRLESLKNAERAFAYLAKDYNAGKITKTHDGERLIIQSRSKTFQHYHKLRESDSLAIKDCMAVIGNGGTPRLRLEVGEK